MAESTSTTNNNTQIEARFCVICSSAASNKIVKDESFVQILDLYWRGIEVDVKPDLSRRLFLCIPCHEKLNNFYQINDMVAYFDAKLKELRMSILSTNVKGMLSWQEKGLKLLPFQAEIMSRWGAKLEPIRETADQAKAVLAQFTATLSKEDVNNDASAKPNSSPVNKPASYSSPNNPKRKRSTKENELDLEYSGGDNFSDDGDVRRKTGQQPSRRTGSSSTTGSNVGITNADETNVGEGDGKFECLNCLTAFDEREKLVSHKKQCPTVSAAVNISE
ncbi:uncharacterized protein LOC110845097 isoform X2 [Folsomia candida]|uniref:uncharacterized protein LOC110845097 isoform X2 n=1 Tax=Folsomia candida TaxID=158441 RepID=UPI000B8EF302|nr:uncharacterized protein LOC110845097 isoform X2 [Folsomia candida]